MMMSSKKLKLRLELRLKLRSKLKKNILCEVTQSSVIGDGSEGTSPPISKFESMDARVVDFKED